VQVIGLMTIPRKAKCAFSDFFIEIYFFRWPT